MTAAAREPRVAVLLDPDWASGSLVDDVRRGFAAHPRTLPPKWLYDDAGSALFDEITRLPEYYPFAAEHSILEAHAAEIATASAATTLVELGSGTSDKTRLLLDAFTRTGQLTRFAPVDVSEQTLRDAAARIAERYAGLEVEAVVGDFTLHLAQLPQGGRRMVAFLGGVLNRELGADFDLEGFSYIPFWDPHMERMDLRLRSEMPQRITIPGADLVLDLASGEEIRVEISTKFRVSKIAAELEGAGLGVTRVWTDDAGDFALTLATKS
ncbi:MAG: L-histidine N(alpha)-methyltransferase [Propionibacteriales bacterium]|nr:L-histidine N(alpha)-methyltransferase [Propionibacteriales bacterium]